MIRRRSAIAVLVVAAVAAVATAAQVSVQVDETIDFEQFRTYALRDGKPAQRLEVQKRIDGFVSRELERRGLRAQHDSPDLLVLTYVLVDKLTLAQLADPTTWAFYVGLTDVDAYSLGAGTLVVDIMQPNDGAVLWRGLVSAPVSGPVEKIERKIDAAVTKMFKRLPLEPTE